MERLSLTIEEERALLPLYRTRPRYFLFTGVLAALVLWALYVWVSQQLRFGLTVTGMNTPAYWGIYIVNFVFFVGLSAGGIVVASLAHALGVERYRPIGRIAELVAISCIILATMFITIDVGRPDRLYRLFLHGRWQSPLIWDVSIITVYLVLAVAMGYFATRIDIVKCMKAMPGRAQLYKLLAFGYTDVSQKAVQRDRKILKTLAFIAIPSAVMLHSITAWLLGLIKATPGWHTALLAPLFIGSALVSGLALVIVAVALCRYFFQLDVKAEVITSLGKLLTFAIPVLGYLLFAELLTVMYAGEPAPKAFFMEMIKGRYAPVFWFDLVAGLIIPFIILVLPRLARSVPAVTIAAGLVVVGVLAERINLVIPPLMTRSQLPYLQGFYTPTWQELSMVVGGYAVGILAFAILAKVVPLVEVESNT
ncbi:MAG: polysulfide reductase NrfD [Chloroflexi bacterium]|nr:polysulfide reductase NrfD [Chloroflexota bacterium]